MNTDDAVQPVTPDRETLALDPERDEFTPTREQVREAFILGSDEEGSGLDFDRWLELHDAALLASGVLGQTSSDVQTGSKFEVPQPQPDRDQIKAAVKSGATDGYWKRTGYRVTWEHLGPLADAITDALLPLLGQPQVPEDAEQFESAIQIERGRQRAKGYNASHDREHGEGHLLAWAEDCIRRGKVIEGAAMIRAVRELRGEVKAQVFEYPPGYMELRAGRAE